MARRRRHDRFQPQGETLERRDLLSRGFHRPIGPIAGAVPKPVEPADFHRQYVRTLAIRQLNSQQSASRISQAFQLFEQGMFGLQPVLPGIPQSGTGTGTGQPPQFRTETGGPNSPLVPLPAGVLPEPFTYGNLIGQLTAYVDTALEDYVVRTNDALESVRKRPRSTPLAQESLIPFANNQITQLNAIIIANPPKFNQQTGALLNPEPKLATEAAFNNILNAVAEYSVHPNLFLQPENFYINPRAKFTIPFDGVPAKKAPGVYVLGPGGIPLAGAHRRPHR